uniref:Uncharacterized protein n=1 Tax=Maylandia zebra TaxID=106582 RepID=A0A3P9DU58_9CICH
EPINSCAELSVMLWRRWIIEIGGHLQCFGCFSSDMEQLLPFFNLLSQVFSSKASSRSGPAYAHNRTDASFPSHKEGHKLESQKVFWSRARQNIEEMVEKDFLEGLIKT